MKIRAVIFSMLLALFVLVSSARAHEMAVGFSPNQDSRQAETQVRQVLHFLTETLEPGQSAFVFDAFHLKTLGVFAVPPGSSYRHAKAKVQANAKTISALLAFAKQAALSPGAQEPSLPGTLRWPQALRFIGQNYPATGKAHLILLGSPLFDDPAEQSFSMRHGRIPSDGHLSHDRSQTPYGIKGQETLLEQWHVHFGFPDETWKRDDHHAYFVQRFVGLHISGQGGQLDTFTSDLPTLFERVRTNAAAPTHQFKVDASDKLEMIQLRPPTVKQTSIYDRPVSSVPLATDVLRHASNVEVGITWECGGCDLDLYGQHAPGAPVLWFLNMQTPEGQYFKDWTSSPRASNGYETLMYRGPIDVKSLLLAVNFYNGHSPGGVRGELRIAINGQTYAKTFHFTTHDGNGGVGREQTLASRRAVNDHWLVIDPLQVLGVQPTQTAGHQP